jgi:prepilin-type processing-associated H-X9-DG protein
MAPERSGLGCVGPVILCLLAVVCLAVVWVLPHGGNGRNLRTTCANNLKQLGTVLVADSVERGWPEDRGAGFLLRLYVRNKKIRGDVKVFKCPQDDRAPWDAGSEEHLAQFESLDPRLTDWPDHITSYAGRDPIRFPIPDDPEVNQPIACDRHAFHDGGVNVLFFDGKVEFIEWADPELRTTEDDFELGPDGPKFLEALCFRPSPR